MCAALFLGGTFVLFLFRSVCTLTVKENIERCQMYANEKRLQDIVEIANRLSTPCACSEQQIALDMSFKMVGRCYEQYFFTNGVKQKCCYNDLGMLSTGAPNGGYVLLETLPFSMDTFHDVCCQNNADEHCKKFYYISPSNNCSGYNPEIPVTSWGDPIIATLDNHLYSFNGRGEYVFLRTENRSLEIQARIDYLKDGNADATIFVAFVIKDNLMNESVTVILNRNNNTMSLFLTNGTLWKTTQCIDDKFQTRAFLIICHNNKGFTVRLKTKTFPISTVDFKVKEFLSVSFDKESAKSSLTTEGLAGKTKNETFCGRNGTHYPINSTESSMYLFGESWRLQNESESYFNYSLIHGGSFVSYHGNHTPPRFLVELVGNLTELFSGYTHENITNFNKTCVRYWDNTVNEECLLTIARTGDVDQGKNIMVEVNATRMTYETMHNSPPKFNSTPEHIVVVYRQNLTWIFNMSSYVTDDGNFNDLTFNVSTNLKEFSLHDGVFNWTIGTELRSISLELKFIVTDRFAASDVFSPKVFYCGCEQPSQCSFSGLDLRPGETFLRASCQCPLSRKGLFCELAANRCSDVHCYKNLTCNDTSDQENPCESCTTGFFNQFNKTHQVCEDIDECSESITRYCEQNCANTIGSYKCSCKQGYQTSTDSNHCDDIDECKKGLHKCSETPYTMCVNSIGSHRCVCQPMYRSINGSCNKIEGFSYVGVVNITVSSETPIGKAYNQSTINAVENRIEFQEKLIEILQELPGFLSIEVLSLHAIANTTTGLDATSDLIVEYIVHFDKIIEQKTLRKIMDQTLWNKTNFVVLKNCARHLSHTLDIYKFLERGLCNITGRTDCMNSTTECTNIQGGYKCKCLPGYVEIPNNNSSCKDCEPLPEIQHGQTFLNGTTTVGAFATVQCNVGYNASRPKMTCQSNGTWSSVICLLKDCGPLDNIPQGFVSTPNGTLVDANAIYNCTFGYVLSGDSNRTCVNGNWSGSVPSCKKDCGHPNITNGAVSTPQGTLDGAIATYSCITGYGLSGGENQTCINGIWTDKVPTCLKDCGHPSITNGAVSTPQGTLDGAIATYSCITGYGLSGGENQTCINGIWTDKVPTCLKDCKSPNTIANGSVSKPQGTLEGANATYNCNSHYVLSGVVTRTCVNGNWSGIDPACQEDTDECHDNQYSCNGTCTNFDGSWSCECPAGYINKTENNKTVKCTDIDECNNASYSCNGTCRNYDGYWGCDCPKGYSNETQNGSMAIMCKDINECTLYPTTACINAHINECINNAGSWNCNCTNGMSLKIVNETSKICFGEFQYPAFMTFELQNSIKVDETVLKTALQTMILGMYVDKFNNSNVYIEIVSINDVPISNTHRKKRSTDESKVAKVDFIVHTKVKKSQEEMDQINTSILNMTSSRNATELTFENQSVTISIRSVHRQNDSFMCENTILCNINTSTCISTYAKLSCDCKAGYHKFNDSFRCEDIDECNSTDYSCNGTCKNEIGNWSCRCSTGYYSSPNPALNNIICIDSCSNASCVNLATCTHSDNSKGYACLCPTGFGGEDCEINIKHEADSKISNLRTILIATGTSLGVVALVLIAIIIAICRSKANKKQTDNTYMDGVTHDPNSKGYSHITHKILQDKDRDSLKRLSSTNVWSNPVLPDKDAGRRSPEPDYPYNVCRIPRPDYKTNVYNRLNMSRDNDLKIEELMRYSDQTYAAKGDHDKWSLCSGSNDTSNDLSEQYSRLRTQHRKSLPDLANITIDDYKIVRAKLAHDSVSPTQDLGHAYNILDGPSKTSLPNINQVLPNTYMERPSPKWIYYNDVNSKHHSSRDSGLESSQDNGVNLVDFGDKYLDDMYSRNYCYSRVNKKNEITSC